LSEKQFKRGNVPVDAVNRLCQDKDEEISKLARKVLPMFSTENPGQF
jgi:hypothetical protein